jgi:hypothetical protein
MNRPSTTTAAGRRLQIQTSQQLLCCNSFVKNLKYNSDCNGVQTLRIKATCHPEPAFFMLPFTDIHLDHSAVNCSSAGFHLYTNDTLMDKWNIIIILYIPEPG